MPIDFAWPSFKREGEKEKRREGEKERRREGEKERRREGEKERRRKGEGEEEEEGGRKGNELERRLERKRGWGESTLVRI